MTQSDSAVEVLVFTDLDGTLLDNDTYQPGPATLAVVALQSAGVAVVFCSAKTRAEQQVLRRQLEISDPYIVENGAALYADSSRLAVFGSPYREVRRQLSRAARTAGVTVRGYGDMTAHEIAERTGLDIEAAARAREREYTETFLIEHERADSGDELRRHLARHGLRMVRGARFWSAQGPHDKGIGVRALLQRRRQQGRPLLAYGIGDYGNDLDMLAAVDVPMLVQRPDESWADIDLAGLQRIEGVGPRGWARAADRVLAEL